jgi:glycosyltransferase involved in cell wall biosynthesis
MKNKILVTVYITNYNYGKYVSKSINSVLDQKFKNFELIIIDDGSNDNSRSIINKYSQDNRVAVIFQNRKGLLACNNLAIKISKGKYIIRLDADDWLAPDALKILYDELEKNKKAGLVFPDYYEVDENGQILRKIVRHNFKKVTLFDQPAHGACTMIRKSFLNKVGNYDETLVSQDGYDVWIKFIKKYKIININKPLFYYRQHKKNLTKDENKILSSRHLILKKNNKSLDKKSIAIIPVRSLDDNFNTSVLKKIKGKPLLNWIIDTSMKSKKILKTIIATSDKRVIKYINRKYKNKVLIFKRSEKLSKINYSLKKTFIEAIKFAKIKKLEFKYVYTLSYKAPFITVQDIDNALNILNLFNTDQVIAVREENNIIYRHDGHSLRLINKKPELILEREVLYKDVGALKVAKLSFFKFNKKNNRIGHSIINQKSSIVINNEFEWKIANSI